MAYSNKLNKQDRIFFCDYTNPQSNNVANLIWKNK